MAIIDTAPLDTSTVPKAVRERAAATERAIALMKEGKDPNDPANHQPTPPAQTPQQPAQEPRQEAKEPERRQEPPAKEPAAQTPSEPRQERGTDRPVEGEALWEQRYKSLQGQFNSINTQLRSAVEDNEALRRAVEELEARIPADGVTRPGNTDFDINKVLSEDEIAEWSPELAAMMGKVVTAATAPLQQEIRSLKNQTGDIVNRDARSAREVMEARLLNELPDFNEINASPDFVEWLNKIDQGAMKRRQPMLQEAYEKNQTDRVLYFVHQFLREVRGVEPEAQGRQDGSQGRARAPKADDLTKFAAPGKGKPSNDGARSAEPDAPRTFTRQEFASFHTDKALKRLKMTPEAIAARQLELETAYNEGRIT